MSVVRGDLARYMNCVIPPNHHMLDLPAAVGHMSLYSWAVSCPDLANIPMMSVPGADVIFL